MAKKKLIYLYRHSNWNSSDRIIKIKKEKAGNVKSPAFFDSVPNIQPLIHKGIQMRLERIPVKLQILESNSQHIATLEFTEKGWNESL